MYIITIKIIDLKLVPTCHNHPPQIMHAIVEKCFDTSERKLWRRDDEKLLIVSTEPLSEPDTVRQLSKEFIITKDYEAFLSSIKDGKSYYFRLTANPVHSVPFEKGKRGKVLAHVTIDQQMGWLRSKADNLGFSLKEFGVSASEYVKFRRFNQYVTLKLATYTGILVVTDRNLLTEAMVFGIGRAKAYGAGLLTLMP